MQQLCDVIVTGGLGFIGKQFVDILLNNGYTVTIIDKVTYAADLGVLDQFDKRTGCQIIRKGIEDMKQLPKCKAIVNFAAESHVDNSIFSSNETVQANYVGVHNLLELIRVMDNFDRPLFLQISTDEVYGDTMDGSFKETDRLRPSNPYSATKAAAEHLVIAYGRTYGLQYLITRSSNNYGPRQFPEKLIPRAIYCAKHGGEFPVHGDGTYVRNWIHAYDNSMAIYRLLLEWMLNPGKFSRPEDKIFNISGSVYKTNMEVLEMVETVSGKIINKVFVDNRYGQDVRYSIDMTKFRTFFPDWKEEKPLSINELQKIYSEDGNGRPT
jgi:dTDP-glucose 4,6-dehydratase